MSCAGGGKGSEQVTQTGTVPHVQAPRTRLLPNQKERASGAPLPTEYRRTAERTDVEVLIGDDEGVLPIKHLEAPVLLATGRGPISPVGTKESASGCLQLAKVEEAAAGCERLGKQLEVEVRLQCKVQPGLDGERVAVCEGEDVATSEGAGEPPSLKVTYWRESTRRSNEGMKDTCQRGAGTREISASTLPLQPPSSSCP